MPTPSLWADLGTYVRTARHRTSRSQSHVACEIGISQSGYSQIERGRNRPRPAVLCRLAVVLRTDITEVARLADYPIETVIASHMLWRGKQ